MCSNLRLHIEKAQGVNSEKEANGSLQPRSMVGDYPQQACFVGSRAPHAQDYGAVLMKVYKAKTKRELKSGKNLWVDVGFTIFVKDDGRMNMVDDRTNISYYLFDTDRKKDSGQAAPAETPAAATDQDIPF